MLQKKILILKKIAALLKRDSNFEVPGYHYGDSIIIASKHFDTLIYLKQDFKEIIDNFPSLNFPVPSHPDIAYAQSGYFKDIIKADGTKKHLTFGSEQGQDKFYILYSYFLKARNNDSTSNKTREHLIAIYQNINDVFGSLAYGGTFFGHQYSRLNAYAEYGVYEYRNSDKGLDAKRGMDNLKQLYLESLKEIIRNEIKNDIEIRDEKNKQEREAYMFRRVKRLDSLITNDFYLKKAQQFHYSYY